MQLATEYAAKCKKICSIVTVKNELIETMKMVKKGCFCLPNEVCCIQINSKGGKCKIEKCEKMTKKLKKFLNSSGR